MQFSRRRFLWGSLLVGCASLVGRLKGESVSSDDLTACLQAWVETLVPTDALSAGAGSLMIHLKVIEKAAGIAQYRRLLEMGVIWANTQAKQQGATSFAALKPEQAEAVVAEAEASGLNAIPGLFFYHTLRDTKHYYYLDAGSWPGVGFPHTPQPLGFMDFAEAPK